MKYAAGIGGQPKKVSEEKTYPSGIPDLAVLHHIYKPCLRGSKPRPFIEIGAGPRGASELCLLDNPLV